MGKKGFGKAPEKNSLLGKSYHAVVGDMAKTGLAPTENPDRTVIYSGHESKVDLR